VLAAPAPEHKASAPGFKYYELQYELHRPTGECELAGELRPVSWSVIKDQQLVQLGELSNRAVDQPQERGDEVFRTSHELIWLKELELVRDGERAPDQVVRCRPSCWPAALALTDFPPLPRLAVSVTLAARPTAQPGSPFVPCLSLYQDGPGSCLASTAAD
jgi:hypothetical protein